MPSFRVRASPLAEDSSSEKLLGVLYRLSLLCGNPPDGSWRRNGASAAIRLQYNLSRRRGLSLRGVLDQYLNPYVSGNSSSKRRAL